MRRRCDASSVDHSFRTADVGVIIITFFFFCRRRRTRAEHEVGIGLFVNTLAGGETWSERCRSDWPGNKARNEIFDTFGFRWEGCGNQILPGPHSVVVSASANRRSTSDVGNLPATNRWTLPLWMNQQGRGCTPCAGRTIPRNTHHRIVPYYSQSINPMGESSKRRGTNRKNSCGIAPTADPVRGDVSSSVIAGRRTECLTTRRERDWRNTERTDERVFVCVWVRCTRTDRRRPQTDSRTGFGLPACSVHACNRHTSSFPLVTSERGPCRVEGQPTDIGTFRLCLRLLRTLHFRKFSQPSNLAKTLKDYIFEQFFQILEKKKI